VPLHEKKVFTMRWVMSLSNSGTNTTKRFLLVMALSVLLGKPTVASKFTGKVISVADGEMIGVYSQSPDRIFRSLGFDRLS
jgi:hypothetical protein